jgi:hypothetical protein
MVTGQPCTIYNCGACGAPAYYNAGHRSWFHYGTRTARPDGAPCGGVSPVPVTLPAPARVS